MGGSRLGDDEFDRRLSEDVKDNWAGILVDRIIESVEVLQSEFRRMAQKQPEIRARSTNVEPLVKRILQDSRDLKEILVEHGLIPVLRRRKK